MALTNNWALIRTGVVFQSLVNTLLQFELPGTWVFDRPGKDAAQDARSADGTIVYQYKHHTVPSFAKTLTDATIELAKISRYKDPNDKRYAHWKDSKEWVLVTNVPVNPNDIKDWNTDIVPGFAAIGLTAILWGVGQLDALLTKYPYVTEAFFEGQNRCFLSLSEAYDYTRADEIGDAGLKVVLVGRDRELNTIDTFLNGTKKLLCIHGPGGIGKSRLLLEIGDRAETMGMQVLWGLEATMSKSQQWFSAVPYTLPTLLILDEPQDPELVNVIAEQIRSPNSQMKGWKVIVAIRSPNDPVLRAINGLPGAIRENEVPLDPLSREQSKNLARALVESSTLSTRTEAQKEAISEHLSKLADRYPIWIAMAVNVLTKYGDLTALPSDSDEIARTYLAEVIERAITQTYSQQQLSALIRWLAIYEEIDIEELPWLKFISSQAGFSDETSAIHCLNALVQRKFVVRRGVNQRLYSIKPDVVRDYVVRDWLTWKVENSVEPTPESRRLVRLMIEGNEKKPLPRLHSLIKGLAKTEYLGRFQGKQLDFLSPLIFELQELARNGSTLEQQAIIGFLGSFDFARLSDVLEIIRTLRTIERPPSDFKDFFGHTHSVAHSDIVTELAWPLFNAARYAHTKEERQSILAEMTALSVYEAKLPGVASNDGKRAEALIPRIISGENNWYLGFSAEALELAKIFVEKLQEPILLDEATLNVTKIFCEPFLSVERERTYYQQHTINVTRWFILLKSQEGEQRASLREALRRCVLTPVAPIEHRIVCWKLLSLAHSSANRALLGPGANIPADIISEIREDLKGDLNWTLSVLNCRPLLLPELKAARHLWDWHFRFEKDEAIKALAKGCEDIYQKDPLVAALHVFFSHELYEQAAAKAVEIGNKLGIGGTCEDIKQFLRQAQEFAREKAEWGNVLEVANHAASHWNTNHELSQFVKMALGGSPEAIEFAFATTLLNRRLKDLRESNAAEQLKSELNDAVAITVNPVSKAQLFSKIYGRPHPLTTGILKLTDLEFISAQLADKSDIIKPWDNCQYLSGVSHTDWETCKTLMERNYNAASGTDRLYCFVAILRGLHFLDLFRQSNAVLAITPAQYDWLLDLMVKLPDLDVLEHQWELTQLVERFGRKNIFWLFSVVEARIRASDAHSANEESEYKIIPTRNRLTKYVATVGPGDTTAVTMKEAMNTFLNYAERKDVVGYILPRYAAELDPQGLIVPELLRPRILSAAGNKEGIWIWSQFAGYYAFNSSAWKTIAIAAIEAVKNLPERDRGSVYVNLLPQEGKTSSYPAGQMDPRPANELRLRKEEFENETDPALMSFRKWHFAMAQAEYEHTVARFREEND